MTSTAIMDQPPRFPDANNSEVGLFSRVRIWWLLLALFLFVQENGLFSKQEADSTAYSFGSLSKDAGTTMVLRLLTAILWVILSVVILPRIHIAFGTLIRQKAIAVTMILAVVSSSWSQISADSFRRAILLSLTLILGSYIVSTYPPATQMRLILATGMIVALASIGMAVIFPEYGLSSAGEWKGVFGHKNRLAIAMVFLFSALPFSPLETSRQKFWCGLQGVTAISLILLSRSKTSLVLVIIVIGVGVFSRLVYRLRKDQLPIVIFTAASLLVLLLVFLTSDMTFFTDLLGKDATLSGRTKNWGILLTFAARHLWLGYGFQGFWTGVTGDSGSALAGIGGAMNGADNGYIDVALQFGLTGLVLLSLIFASAFRDFTKILRRPLVPPVTFWYVSIMLILLVGNITETLFWEPSHASTLFLVLACGGLRSLSLETPAATSELANRIAAPAIHNPKHFVHD